jgi:small-conductance mechanosensitive channel
MNDTPSPTDLFTQINVGNLLQALLVLAIVWVVVRLTTGFLERMGVRFPARRLLINQVSSTVRFLIWTVGVALAVVALDLSKEFMLTLTGAAAVTIGFALKDIAASVIAGIIIIVDRPFQVGDRVSFGGYYGDIKEIGLRSVRLVTLDDNLITIPNNKFLTDLSSSGNAGALDMMVPCDFWVATDQDVGAARRLVERCLVANPYVFTGKPWGVLVAQVAQPQYVAYRIRAKAYVLDTRYEKLFETDLTERVHEAFRDAGIRPPLAPAAARA